MVEIAWQFEGRAEGRQVENARIGLTQRARGRSGSAGHLFDQSAEPQQFLVSCVSLSGTDLIMTSPVRIAKAFAPKFKLVLRELPIDIGRFSVALVWHRRTNLQPALSWLRREIARFAKDFDK